MGHFEVDTVLGDSQGGACIVTPVERKIGYVVIGKLERRTAAELNARLEALVLRQARPVRTITADNGIEFHSYKAFEQRVTAKFYFATPHHSWERGSNENMNGLIRQYLPGGGASRRRTATASRTNSTAARGSATAGTLRGSSMPPDTQRCTSNLTSDRAAAQAIDYGIGRDPAVACARSRAARDGSTRHRRTTDLPISSVITPQTLSPRM